MKTSKLSIRLLWYITPLVILPLLFLGGFTLTNVTNSTQKQADLIMSRFVEQQQQKVFNYIDSFHATAKLLSASPVLSDFLAKDLFEFPLNIFMLGDRETNPHSMDQNHVSYHWTIPQFLIRVID